jgi:hypothetical protein
MIAPYKKSQLVFMSDFRTTHFPASKEINSELMGFILTLTSNVPRLFAMIYLEERRVVWKRVKGRKIRHRNARVAFRTTVTSSNGIVVCLLPFCSWHDRRRCLLASYLLGLEWLFPCRLSGFFRDPTKVGGCLLALNLGTNGHGPKPSLKMVMLISRQFPPMDSIHGIAAQD